ncbi:electron transport protein [Bacillus sp. HMF5848]|uniref:electron transport protein n=1 Tax=Bacillus sp. HMF5848 TaxID=2495421 RepID=UPI000F769FB7|nr:electron transport protein [Bacillus sp. HMF5848]RSK26033.1 electron transport protein [Bacillus sp. HMF5848]
MKKRSLIISSLAVGGIIFLTLGHYEMAYTPKSEKIVNPQQNVTTDRNYILQTTTRDAQLAQELTPEHIEFGKESFFKDTFGNEVFFTDIMGIFNGPITLVNIAKAINQLGGKGTTNLQVKLAEDYSIGDYSFKKGDKLDTGLDVPKGSYIPLGVKFVYDKGRVRAGITCAACHATTTRDGQVIQGAPNTDLNIGTVLAMATNTASYFTHTEIKSIKDYITERSTSFTTPDGKANKLPDPEKLEQFVDSQIIEWPKGSNDTTIEFKNNPVQIPDVFTLGDHPYGWSGQGLAGPYKGLTAAINNAHTQNMDATSQSELSKKVLQIDKDVYLGTLLQNAANSEFRYDSKKHGTPSEFFKTIDPTPGTPGVNELIISSSYPTASYMSSTGLLSSSPGYKAWEQMNAMSAYMNTLQPPQTVGKGINVAKGEAVYQKAGCITCHGGTYFTNNHLIPTSEIKTESSRAIAFAPTERLFGPPSVWDPSTPVPLPDNPKALPVPLTPFEQSELAFGWAHNNAEGGYKIPSLLGLKWSAPYLHDGGVAVGADNEFGAGNTLFKNIQADPANSLRALLDRWLRHKVIEANKEYFKTARVTGAGHNYWVDEQAGYTAEEQQALIDYLLQITSKEPTP